MILRTQQNCVSLPITHHRRTIHRDRRNGTDKYTTHEIQTSYYGCAHRTDTQITIEQQQQQINQRSSTKTAAAIATTSK